MFQSFELPSDPASLAILAVAASSFVWMFRNALSSLVDKLVNVCSFTMDVHMSDSLFHPLLEWLSTKKLVAAKDMAISMDYKNNQKKANLVLGRGNAFIIERGLPLMRIARYHDESVKANYERSDAIHIRLFCFRRKHLFKLLAEITKHAAWNNRAIYDLTEGGWYMSGEPVSVDLPPSEAAQALADLAIDRYRRSPETRRGYLLHGVPGSGKTKLVLFVSQTLNLPIYTVAVNNKEDDESRLMRSLRDTPKHSILLIDDIDMSELGQKRGGNTPLLQALLNVIDGVVKFDSRILFIATNNPDSLDDALVRKGRIDDAVEIKLLTPEEQVVAFERHYGKRPLAVITNHRSTADLYSIFNDHEDDPAGAEKALAWIVPPLTDKPPRTRVMVPKDPLPAWNSHYETHTV